MRTYQLRAIFWKNLLLRKNSLITTIVVVFALPILSFLLLAFIHSRNSAEASAKVKTVTHHSPKDILGDKFKNDKSEIYYNPSNTYFDNLLNRVGKQFEMSYTAIHKVKDLKQIVEQSAKSKKDHVFLIIFHSAAESRNLDYTIRVRENISSLEQKYSETKSLYLKSGNHTGVGSHYLDNGFVAIQKAVDISFMEMEQEKRKLFSKIVAGRAQEFPYPPHKTSETVETISTTLPIFTWFSFCLITMVTLKSITEEKYTGIKELMKVVGLSNWVIWIGWLLHNIFPMLIVVSIMVIFLKVNIFGRGFPIFEYTQGTIVYVFLMLYICATTTQCFFISTWTDKPNMASLIGQLVSIVSFFVPLQLIQANYFSFSAGMALMLLPQAAIIYGYRAMAFYESGLIGSKWSNFHVAGDYGGISLLHVFIMLVVDCLIYMLLTFYLDVVNPGKYGVPRSLIFPFEDLWKVRLFRSSLVVNLL
ncbi:unnamed protein product [Ceutorhynchus assimilis]|uniref:ABC-2 type transporter transmembrane domain-containing protein n=1 Tax=Ceutorhynchus assimilis TaxID=467358 RepID=A0A9N9QRH0_9CUCU|nr:unnamed protein product [Ceutorhynchus assimilis]